MDGTAPTTTRVRTARTPLRCRLGFHAWLSSHADPERDVLTCSRCGRLAYLDTTVERWGEPTIGHTTYVGHPT